MKTVDVLQRSTIRKLNTLPPRRTFKKINSRKDAKVLPSVGRPACRKKVYQLINLRVFSAVICVSFFSVLDLR
jgi:hypothetical protein